MDDLREEYHSKPTQGKSAGVALRVNMHSPSMYHSNFSHVSRSKGASAVAAAAYRTGERFVDERTGEVHDYTKKGGVECSGIIVPDNAPGWAYDREKLWNEAEKAENRSNSRTVIKNTISLPADLDQEQRALIVEEYCKKISEKHGVVVDYSLHAPGKGDNDKNYHAHVAITTRRIDEKGFTDKAREWSVRSKKEWDKIKIEDKYQDKFNGMTGKDIIEHWRAELADITNHQLVLAGKEPTWDSKSLKARGVERNPTKHMGPAATQIEREGKESELGSLNRQIKEANEMVEGLAEIKAEFEKELGQNNVVQRVLRNVERLDKIKEARMAKGGSLEELEKYNEFVGRVSKRTKKGVKDGGFPKKERVQLFQLVNKAESRNKLFIVQKPKTPEQATKRLGVELEQLAKEIRDKGLTNPKNFMKERARKKVDKEIAARIRAARVAIKGMNVPDGDKKKAIVQVNKMSKALGLEKRGMER